MFTLTIDDQLVPKIKSDTISILSQIGIELSYQPALKLLLEAGAKVKNGRVFFSEEMILDAVSRCPSNVKITGRDKKKIINLGDGNLYCHNLGGASKVYDHNSKKTRPATIKDIIKSAILLDSLDSVTSITPLFTPTEVSGELMTPTMIRHTLPHTTKPVHGPGVFTAKEVSYIYELATVVGDPCEMITLGISPESALRFPDHVVEAILRTASLKIPFGPLPCPIAGATSPMSPYGSLVQQNAEVIAAIIIAQFKQPGLPIFYCGRLSSIDPVTMKSRWSGPEVGMMSAVTVALGHSYRLPVNVYGITSTTIIDEQRTFERMSNALLPALAMADELSGIGELECGQTSSLAQIVFDIDIIDYIQHIRKGIRHDQEALEVIDQVVDSGGIFADKPHTVKHLRSVTPSSISYKSHEQAQLWEGSLDWANNRASQILKVHQVPSLEKQQIEEMDRIMKSADKETKR
jgi:trimethylamine--corrinoid protein Co-methyltransferase